MFFLQHLQPLNSSFCLEYGCDSKPTWTMHTRTGEPSWSNKRILSSWKTVVHSSHTGSDHLLLNWNRTISLSCLSYCYFGSECILYLNPYFNVSQALCRSSTRMWQQFYITLGQIMMTAVRGNEGMKESYWMKESVFQKHP